ncbi:KLTH0B02992p [Lachancea thermotolerans CBS 6340]|uniref:KLTH0B02992p n=1 Tax=Lachancea thermotolerans (strain ATCC 56472 / CBS 6340 / NRRL Y-8284) TaxID=559295 RepID=C5DCH0_LACTC|nr:KLTH0B02992p [Lachancea thermotolerans CBS 6340]CAR21481.1 KLTH0B02992p [Lachancea thermotolerans CBS 6340]
MSDTRWTTSYPHMNEFLSDSSQQDNKPDYYHVITEETSRLKDIEKRMAENAHGAGCPGFSRFNDQSADARSVYVGNLDPSINAETLQEFFKGSVSRVNRVEIQINKLTGFAKGFAFVEFAQPRDVMDAIKLSNTKLGGKPLKIVPKRPSFHQESPNRGSHRMRRATTRTHPPLRGRPHGRHLHNAWRGNRRGRVRARGRGKRFI